MFQKKVGSDACLILNASIDEGVITIAQKFSANDLRRATETRSVVVAVADGSGNTLEMAVTGVNADDTFVVGAGKYEVVFEQEDGVWSGEAVSITAALEAAVEALPEFPEFTAANAGQTFVVNSSGELEMGGGDAKVYNHVITITLSGFTGTNKPKAIIPIASASNIAFTKETFEAYLRQKTGYFENFKAVQGDAGATNKIALISHFAQVGTSGIQIYVYTYTYTTDGTAITISSDISSEYLSSNSVWFTDEVYEA